MHITRQCERVALAHPRLPRLHAADSILQPRIPFTGRYRTHLVPRPLHPQVTNHTLCSRSAAVAALRHAVDNDWMEAVVEIQAKQRAELESKNQLRVSALYSSSPVKTIDWDMGLSRCGSATMDMLRPLTCFPGRSTDWRTFVHDFSQPLPLGRDGRRDAIEARKARANATVTEPTLFQRITTPPAVANVHSSLPSAHNPPSTPTTSKITDPSAVSYDPEGKPVFNNMKSTGGGLTERPKTRLPRWLGGQKLSDGEEDEEQAPRNTARF